MQRRPGRGEGGRPRGVHHRDAVRALGDLPSLVHRGAVGVPVVVPVEDAGDLLRRLVALAGDDDRVPLAGVFHRYNDRDAYRTAVDQRWQVTERPDGVTVVAAREASTLASARAALHDLVRQAGGRRTVAVLAVPDDLGTPSVTDLDELGRLAVRLGIDHLLVVGEPARAVHTGAVQEGSFDGESHLVPDAAAARSWLTERLRPGDVVLVKGSRAAGLGQPVSYT